MLIVAVVLLLASPAVRAQLRCDPSVVDFGRRPENGTFDAEARITNIMPHSIRILSAEGDCGCLTADVAVRSLGPGESAALEIHMQSGGVEGEFRHTVTVTTAEGPSAVLAVRMAVYRYVNWSVEPTRLILPPSPRGMPSVTELRVTHIGAVQLGIASVESGSSYVTVAPENSLGNTITYTVTKLPDAPAGAVYADIRISTVDPQSPTLEVPVFAYVTSGFEVLPNPIVMSAAPSGMPVETEAKIRGWDGAGRPRAEFDGGGAKVSRAKGGEWNVRLTLAHVAAGAHTSQLRLYDGSNLVATVPVVERSSP